MTDGTMRVAMFGTFDVRNYGDLLFPLIAQDALEKRIQSARIIPFSYHRSAPPDWPLEVSPISEFAINPAGYAGAIIGGGHIVRFDKSIAPGYGPSCATIHHPTGYWLIPALVAASHGLPVIWNAPSASDDPPEWGAPLMRAALDMSRYVSVRDRHSFGVARAAGFEGLCHIVPDSAFGIGDLLPNDKIEVLAQPLLTRAGVERDYIVLQANRVCLPVAEALARDPRVTGNFDILLLPIGPDLLDEPKPLSAVSIDFKTINSWPKPLEIAALIAHSAGVIGPSLHLAVTALSFGVPVLRPATKAFPKYQMLKELDGVVEVATDAFLPDTFVNRLGTRAIAPGIVQVKEALSTHWNEIAAAIMRGPEPPDYRVLSSLWRDLPIAIDTYEARLRSASTAEHVFMSAQRHSWLARLSRKLRN